MTDSLWYYTQHLTPNVCITCWSVWLENGYKITDSIAQRSGNTETIGVSDNEEPVCKLVLPLKSVWKNRIQGSEWQKGGKWRSREGYKRIMEDGMMVLIGNIRKIADNSDEEVRHIKNKTSQIPFTLTPAAKPQPNVFLSYPSFIHASRHNKRTL